MTSTVADAHSATGESSPADERTGVVTALDLLALALALALAVVAWASLAFAHLGHHSLPAVATCTAVVLGAVAIAVRRWAWPRVTPDRAGIAAALVCAGVSLSLTLPGFSYGVADKDPGVYVSHAISIARTGDYAVHDDLLAQTGKDPSFPVRLTSPGARFPGVWVRDSSSGLIVPQFYHLWPALMATAYDADGLDGLRSTTPLIGALCVLLLFALLRRAGNLLGGSEVALWTAGIGGLLLATNMMQVWQARYPTTEILSQALFLAALLGIVVAVRERWAPAAGLAGLVVGVGWLNRADGVLLVLLSVGLGAALLVLGRWDRRSWWFATGLCLVLPHALVQAYDLAKGYSVANGVPTLRTIAVLAIGALGTGAVLGRVGRRPLRRVQERLLAARPQLVMGAVVVGGSVALLGLGFLRPRLFGAVTTTVNGQLMRTYDEQNLRRLSWFLTLPAFAILPLGIAVVALRRWHATLWTLTIPTLLLLPLYAYAGRNSSRMMWWTRRYIPTVLPGIVVLLALALGFALLWRFRGRTILRIPAVLTAAGLLAAFLHQSVPLRGHDEWQGSFQVSAQIAALAHGQRGIFLWESDVACCNGPTHLFPTSVWLQHGQESSLLAPNDPADGQSPMAMIDRYRQVFPTQPIFVVTGRGRLPDGVDATRVTQVADIRTSMPMWNESDLMRPAGAHRVSARIEVWKVTA